MQTSAIYQHAEVLTTVSGAFSLLAAATIAVCESGSRSASRASRRAGHPQEQTASWTASTATHTTASRCGVSPPVVRERRRLATHLSCILSWVGGTRCRAGRSATRSREEDAASVCAARSGVVLCAITLPGHTAPYGSTSGMPTSCAPMHGGACCSALQDRQGPCAFVLKRGGFQSRRRHVRKHKNMDIQKTGGCRSFEETTRKPKIGHALRDPRLQVWKLEHGACVCVCACR